MIFGALPECPVLKRQSWTGRREDCRGEDVSIDDVRYLRKGEEIEKSSPGYIFLFK